MVNVDNEFLNGPYAPWREEGEAFDLEIEGELPRELNGALYRVGSNQHFPLKNPRRYHWFDGDGMVHEVFLRDGRATYRNRYVQTAGLKLEMQQGHAIFSSMINGFEPGPIPPNTAPVKNPANTNVTLFNDRLLVFCETDVPHELRPDNLETVGMYNFQGAVAGPVTAHFKIDPNNGDMLFYSAMGRLMTWYRADRHGKVLDSYRFDMGVPTFIHDYVTTPDYAIFLVNPTIVNQENFMRGQPTMVWDPDMMPFSRFAVLNRHNGNVSWIDATDAFTQTHFFNAYQDGSKIIIDGQRVSQFGISKEQLASWPPEKNWNQWFTSMVATPWRWELNLATGALGGGALTDVQGEFPRINDEFTGQRHRFGYYATTRGTTNWFTDGLAKHDIERKRTDVQQVGSLLAPNEPVFVPREGATSEDDGWLLSIWWDPALDRSEVVVQNAQDFTAKPLARIKLNHRIPLGFHGNWIPASEIEASLR